MRLCLLSGLLVFVANLAMASFSPHRFRFSLQQTMLRIKDPSRTVPFYQSNFGMTLLHKYDFPEYKFSLYFLGIPPAGEPAWPEPGTKESEERLWSMPFSCIELTHNWQTETQDDFKVNNGNVEPHRGFGHLAFMTPDVYASCAKLEAACVRFQKKPDEGRMKGLAFALCPDGYWLEVIPRSPQSTVPPALPYTLAQTMMRVKDPVKSLRFYCDLLGMKLLRVSDFSDFSLYFLATVPEGVEVPADPKSDEAAEFIRRGFFQVLELTHNHGTEADAAFSYHNGNDEDLGAGKLRGFGHVGFLVSGLDEACSGLEAAGVAFRKRPQDGAMRGLAFALDPDGYSVELIERGASFA